MKILQTTWVTAAVGTVLFLGTMVMLLRPQQFVAARPTRPAAGDASAHAPTSSWEFRSPEADQLTAELKTERAAVAQKEKQLNDLAARLQAERSELNIITQSVHRMQVEFDRTVVRVREEELGNLKKLARTYATMTPEGAAAILRQQEDDSAVKILVFMKEGETAPILETLARLGETEAKRAATLADRLRLTVKPVTPK